ncbi:aliphatic sulfonate ABC transporter substrate-binding protein [Synechococcus sp. RSCCF101]|uniref:ABC transporter substrate-binding protein n=1 Tax=Synechococcus sp. RSCCF101 TaxID=2511069 RepID=UPI001248D838|nr:ABC transporter substrate-binding protein [Synechococcus sp. RSCCF101]QEY31913.1 aliphatic sulfonate ABC transporter substrate-binding protein [Synechococcus sp. RSCCF101]
MLRQLRTLALAALALVLAVACARGGPGGGGSATGEPIVLGYSNWAGWWPWAIAVEEKLFEKNGVNVEMQWFDGYVQSMETFAAGKIDGNSQTLNDTISFLPGANGGAVVVLVNDNSAGNDQIIADESIRSIKELKGKTVAVEEGVVDDFLLSLALEDNGMTRDDVIIKGLPTDQAATAFAAGQVDAVGAFPPFTGTAMKREGAHVIASSKEYPGAIPDLMAVSADLIDQRPDDVQKIVQTWWDVRDFMAAEPERSDEIMARRAGITPEEYDQYRDGTRFFTIEDNIEAFSPGEGMQHMPYAAEKMADFMVKVGFIPEKPDMSNLFNPSFIKALS